MDRTWTQTTRGWEPNPPVLFIFGMNQYPVRPDSHDNPMPNERAPQPMRTQIAHPKQSKIILKMMTRALRGRVRKGLFQHAKRKKVKLV